MNGVVGVKERKLTEHAMVILKKRLTLEWGCGVCWIRR